MLVNWTKPHCSVHFGRKQQCSLEMLINSCVISGTTNFLPQFPVTKIEKKKSVYIKRQ